MLRNRLHLHRRNQVGVEDIAVERILLLGLRLGVADLDRGVGACALAAQRGGRDGGLGGAGRVDDEVAPTGTAVETIHADLDFDVEFLAFDAVVLEFERLEFLERPLKCAVQLLAHHFL